MVLKVIFLSGDIWHYLEALCCPGLESSAVICWMKSRDASKKLTMQNAASQQDYPVLNVNHAEIRNHDLDLLDFSICK